jgi:hypothetical protein
VTSNLEPSQTGLEIIARSSDGRISSQEAETVFELGKVFICLAGSPGSDRVRCDQSEIVLGFEGDPNNCHDQALFGGKLYFLRRREKTSGSEIPLAIPFLMAARSARIFSSCTRSSCSRRRNAARITSLALA